MPASLLDDLAAGRVPGVLALTTDQVHRMVEQGILADGAPLELIEGLLVRKDRAASGEDTMTHGRRHALAGKLLQRLDRRLAGLDAHVSSQLPLTLGVHDEPEPDLAVLRGSPRQIGDRHPGAADVLVVVEVSDSSLEFDRTTKQRLYARAGIPQYVIVNLRDDVVEVLEGPDRDGAAYLEHRTYHAREVVPFAVGGLAVGVENLVPPRP